MLYNIQTGELVTAYFREVTRNEIKTICNKGWGFNWNKPYTQGFTVYGLVTEEYPKDIQGLIALNPNYDSDFRCIDLDIVESAPHNKKYTGAHPNTSRLYKGVGKVLIAFACGYSFLCNLDGFVELTSKTSKRPFYLKMGAKTAFSNIVYFPTKSAIQITKNYLPGGVLWWEE